MRGNAEAAYRKAYAALRTGDFKISLAQAREGLQRWPEGDWGWSFRLLCAENLLTLSHRKEAAEHLQKAGEPSRRDLRARLAMDRARVAMGSNRENGLKLMREALGLSVGAGDAALVCMIRLRLTEVTAGSDAETLYRAALADAERQHDPYLASWALVDLGYNKAHAGRYDEAVPILEQARQIAQQANAKSFVVWATGNLGWCYVSLGDLDRAMSHMTSAEDLSAKIGLRDAQHRWLGAIGNIYMARGDLDRAVAYQQRAADVAREVGNDTWLAIALSNLAEVSIQKRDLAAAQSFNDQALAIKRRLADPVSLAYSEWNAAKIEASEGKYGEAERAYQAVIEHAPQAHAPQVLWAAYGGLAVVYQETHRPKLAEIQYRNAIDTIDREWNKLSSDESKTTFLAPTYLIGLFQGYVDFLVQNRQTDRALQMAESSRARVLNERLERVGAVPPNFRMDQLLAAARSTHTVILSYWLAPAGSSVWVIGERGVSHHPLPAEKDITELVGKYTEMITQGGDPLAHADAVSAALYNAVLAPVAQLIPPGANVIVVPDGALHQLNFETLVVPGSQPRYWIEDVALATAPSLRVLQGGEPRVARASKLLLLGDPVLGQEFGPLPKVKQEIAAVEGYFPAANQWVRTGAAAVPAEYAKASPAQFTNIHFATHATANQESPLNSAIILSHQGEAFKLYARDVAAVPLSADLVTISACQSAGAKAYSGEGLMGFAWAFLQAGAQNVIATLWNEDDDASVELMRRLYAGIAAGETPARALRSAKLGLLHGAGRFRLPYYWGPLQVFTRRIGARGGAPVLVTDLKFR